MRVVEIVIDGFKSYAVRTVISGWDESFNSITGLNGSGKSNILDAICFVLGITSMSTVRAQNIQVCFYVLSRHVLNLLLMAALSLGPNLQTRPSWRHQSQRYYCFRQPRQEEVPHWLRRIWPDLGHAPDRARRHKQIPHQWPPCAATDCPKPLPIRTAQHQQSQFPDHARANHQGAEYEARGNIGDD